MRNSKLLRLVAPLLCVAALAGAAMAPVVVSADEDEEVPRGLPDIEEIFQIVPKFPAMEGPGDAPFQFEVEFVYRSGDPMGRSFDLTVTGPTDWLTYVAESTHDLEQQISAIFLQPYEVQRPIVVVAMAPFWLYPEPGDYEIEVHASSGDLEDSATVTASITPRYELDAETAGDIETARVTAGGETTFGLNVLNIGTARMENVTLSATTPPDVGDEEWTIGFEPEVIEDLPPGDDVEVLVSIVPPAGTVAGDYLTTLSVEGAPELSSAPPSVPVRVIVAGQSTWNVAAAVILIAVAAALGLWGYRRYAQKKARGA